jgi:hypothetical protein
VLIVFAQQELVVVKGIDPEADVAERLKAEDVFYQVDILRGACYVGYGIAMYEKAVTNVFEGAIDLAVPDIAVLSLRVWRCNDTAKDDDGIRETHVLGVRHLPLSKQVACISSLLTRCKKEDG